MSALTASAAPAPADAKGEQEHGDAAEPGALQARAHADRSSLTIIGLTLLDFRIFKDHGSQDDRLLAAVFRALRPVDEVTPHDQLR